MNKMASSWVVLSWRIISIVTLIVAIIVQSSIESQCPESGSNCTKTPKPATDDINASVKRLDQIIKANVVSKFRFVRNITRIEPKDYVEYETESEKPIKFMKVSIEVRTKNRLKYCFVLDLGPDDTLNSIDNRSSQCEYFDRDCHNPCSTGFLYSTSKRSLKYDHRLGLGRNRSNRN